MVEGECKGRRFHFTMVSEDRSFFLGTSIFDNLELVCEPVQRQLVTVIKKLSIFS